MKTVRYIGSTPARDLALPNDHWVRVERGQVVEVPDDVADSLAQQQDWEAVSEPKPPKKGGDR